jgi:6-phosphogluconolactonase (cycloisomerase 2 family)
MIGKFLGSLTLALSTAAILSGCGGGGAAPQPSPEPPPQPQAPGASTQILYSASSQTSTSPSVVTAFAIDPQRGTLTPIPGSPFTLTLPTTGLDAVSGLEGLSVDPNNAFLFVRGQTIVTHTIHGDILLAFPLNPSTRIVEGTSMKFGTGHASTVVLHPSGKFLYFNDEQNGLIAPAVYGGIEGWSFPVSGTSFTQIQGSPFGQHVTGISIDPAGRLLYATLDVSSTPGAPSLQIYSIDQSTGALSLISSSVIQIDSPLTFHPSGKFAFALHFIYVPGNTNISATTLDVYSVDSATGALTFVRNEQLENAFLDPSGRFLYSCKTSSLSGCQWAGFMVDANTGTLNSISGFDPGVPSFRQLVFDKSGQHAYLTTAVNGVSSIVVFSVDTVTGNWSQIQTLPSAGPIATSH